MDQQPSHAEPPPSPGRLHKAIEAIMAASLAVMVVAVFTNVVLRYVFDTGIVFYEELSRLLFVWLVCIGAILAAVEGKHLGFDMIVSRLSGVPLKVCTGIATLLTAMGLVLVAKGAWDQVIAGLHTFSTVIRYPLALAAAAVLIMAIGMLVVLVMQVTGRRRVIHQDTDVGVE
ncbi:MAG: TRAP transporter small permease [Rhodocyclaceae bacterium]